MNLQHRRAQQLDTLCSLWLTHNKEDLTQARYTQPYLLPRTYPDAKEVNTAIKEAWVANWDWQTVFDAWRNRTLENYVKSLEADSKSMNQGELL